MRILIWKANHVSVGYFNILRGVAKLYKNIVITYLVDGKKYGMIFPYRKEGNENEILEEAEQEMIKKGFDDFELLEWRWVEAVC